MSSYEIRVDGGIAEIDFVEVPDLGDLERALDEIERHPGFTLGMPLILHATAKGWNPTTGRIHHLADVLGSRREVFGGRVAAVAPTPLYHGLTRMLAAWAEPKGVIIEPFPNAAEARAWLASFENGEG